MGRMIHFCTMIPNVCAVRSKAVETDSAATVMVGGDNRSGHSVCVASRRIKPSRMTPASTISPLRRGRRKSATPSTTAL